MMVQVASKARKGYHRREAETDLFNQMMPLAATRVRRT
jgi:hypothetical protein